MDNNPSGPYKHYERPEQGRAAGKKPTSRAWGFVFALLIIILIALLPFAHHLAMNNAENKSLQPKEVERVKSTPKKKKSTAQSQSSKKTKKAKKIVSAKPAKKQSQASSSSKTYVVQDGDTLTSIAQKNGMSVEELAKLNNLDSNASIAAGQTLKLN